MKLAARDDRQLAIALADPPRQEKTAALRSYHTKNRNVPVEEALQGERRARGQEARILAWFRAVRPGYCATPTDVYNAFFGRLELTSVRRALSNLSDEKRYTRPPLRHNEKDYRPSPRDGTETTWSLAEARS